MVARLSWLSFACLVSASAQAAPLFWEDFEGPDLTRWSFVDRKEGATLQRVDAAARWGDGGLRVEDTDAMAGVGDMSAVYERFDAGSSSITLRLWSSVSRPTSGEAVIAQLFRENQGTTCGFNVVAGTVVAFWDAHGTYQTSAPVPLDAGWHLYECRAQGVGTDGGTVEAWLDGSPIAVARGLAWPSQTPNIIGVGQPYSEDRRFVGIVDVDNVRLGVDLAPSRAEVRLQSSGSVGECVQTQVSLVDSSNTAASPDRPSTLSIALDGGRAFMDATCQTPLSAVVFQNGDLARAIFIIAERSQAVVALSGEDVLPSVTPLRFDAGSEDGGTDGGAGVDDGGSTPGDGVRPVNSQYGVGCGCALDGGGGSLLVLLALASGRRRGRLPCSNE
ncbi:MAG: hypothetical protein Q8N26_05680 [Myxococcales bacterium]|nr:hypothetical protein [Myxococcales bacterium]